MLLNEYWNGTITEEVIWIIIYSPIPDPELRQSPMQVLTQLRAA